MNKKYILSSLLLMFFIIFLNPAIAPGGLSQEEINEINKDPAHNLNEENVAKYADTTNGVDTIIEKRPDLIYKLNQEQIGKANYANLEKSVKQEDAIRYIHKRIADSGAFFSPANKNEWALWKKAYPNAQVPDSLHSADVKLGDSSIKTFDFEIDFGDSPIDIKNTKNGLIIWINDYKISRFTGKLDIGSEGDIVFEKGARFMFMSRLTEKEIAVRKITADTQLGGCESAITSCIDEKDRERRKNTGEILKPGIKFEKRFTRELDINLEDGNSMIINVPQNSFDDVNINKKEDSEAWVNVIDKQSDLATIHFPKYGYPGIQLFNEGTKGELTPDFHYNYVDRKGKEHKCHIVEGNMIHCSLCGKLGYVKTFGDDAIPFEIEHPAYDLNGYKVVIGGKFRPVLDKEWYSKKAMQASKLGVDPYLWIAFSLEEYGGYRVGKTSTPQKIQSRWLSELPTGNDFVPENGAAGILLGDQFAASGIIYEKDIQNELKQKGATLLDNPFLDEYSERIEKIRQSLNLKKSEIEKVYYFELPKYGGTATQEQLDEQSFIILKKLQKRVLYFTDKKGGDAAYGLQSLHGYGFLPYLYKEGYYGNHKEVSYDSQTGLLGLPNGINSGIKGKEYPIYGYTLAYFIKSLHDDPRIKEIISENAPTPVADSVIQYFNKT